MRVKISPSLLEQWRTVRLGLYNKGVDALEDYILGKREPNLAMSRGRAYHRLLEEGPEKFKGLEAKRIWSGVASHEGSEMWADYDDIDVDCYLVPDDEMKMVWKFEPAAVEPAIALHQYYRNGIHEVWGRYETLINGVTVVSNQKYDMLNGLHIEEFKTTGSAKKQKDYANSMQWKMYVLGLDDAQQITYHVFQLPRLSSEKTRNSWCRYKQFTLHRYPMLEYEVKIEIQSLLDFLSKRPELIKKLIID